jgi:peptidoglycan-associated lipoprotein
VTTTRSTRTRRPVAGLVGRLQQHARFGARTDADAQSAPASPAASSPLQRPPHQANPSSTVATVSLPAYLDPKSDISTGRSVYFDFDMALVKPEFSNLVERHGRYLSSNPRVSIKIEGNTDERGGAEYNLALGQKRAEAVRQALKMYGVKETQMEPSVGQRAQMVGHDESAGRRIGAQTCSIRAAEWRR